MTNVEQLLTKLDLHHLVALVRERPVLWDKTLPQYKSKKLSNLGWSEVCIELLYNFNELEPDEQEEFGKGVCNKWKNMKDNFFKYLRKINTMKANGEVQPSIKKYRHFDRLLFLEKLEWNEKDDTLDPLEAAPNPRKRKAVDSEYDEDEDRHMSFFKSMLPSLKKLNDVQTLMFQSRVLQVVTQMVYPMAGSSNDCAPQTDDRYMKYPGNYRSESDQSTQGPDFINIKLSMSDVSDTE